MCLSKEQITEIILEYERRQDAMWSDKQRADWCEKKMNMLLDYHLEKLSKEDTLNRARHKCLEVA